jgi:hypothetical protein
MARERAAGIMWYFEAVSRGEHYKGWVEINKVVFNYELILAIPFPRLLPADLPENIKDVGEIRRRFRLTLQRGNTELDLDDAEYGIFLALTFGQLLREGRESPPSFELGMTVISLHPSACETLSTPKFGCVFDG